MPAANRVHTPVDCPVCHKTVSRKGDLPRHMRTHDGNKEALMHACPFPDCDYKTLQKSNVQTHIRTHTRDRSKMCPHPGCAFATTDPGSLTRHRKQLHGYEPKARRNLGGRAARQSATAPYPSPRPMNAEVQTPASLDLNALTFPALADLISCNAPSPAESSNSSLSQLSCDVADFSWEQLFLDLSDDSFSSVYSQPSQLPIPASSHFQPPTVPFDLSTLHMPLQYESELFSDVDFQCQPIPDVNFQYQPIAGNNLNHSQPDILEEFLQNNGSGYFDGCGYQYNTTYPMTQPALASGYNVY